jgi:putative methyltransferase (TIGR04325 family)
MQVKGFVATSLRAWWRHMQPQPTGAPVYASYGAALAACHGGYEDPQLIRTVYEKTRIFRNLLASHHPPVFDLSALRTLVGVSLAVPATARELHVLDFGGACGLHYFIARAFLGDRMRLRWHVVETAPMAAVAQDFEDGQLHFFETLSRATAACEPIDLVFSSGALQYVPEPYATLGALTQCGATTLFLTRLGLTSHPADLITIQTAPLSAHGPGPLPAGMPDATVTWPIIFARKEKVEDIIKHQYAITLLFDEGKPADFAGMRGLGVYGYVATLQRGRPA